MPILFSAVAHERTIVEKFATCEGNFMEILEEIVTKIPDTNGKMTYSHGHYLLHHIVENDFYYFCITDKMCQRSRAFLFLSEIKRKYTPLFDGDFCSVLADEMYRYSEDYNTIVIKKGDLDELNTISVGSSETLLGEKILLVPNPEIVEYGTISYLKRTPQQSIISEIHGTEKKEENIVVKQEATLNADIKKSNTKIKDESECRTLKTISSEGTAKDKNTKLNTGGQERQYKIPNCDDNEKIYASEIRTEISGMNHNGTSRKTNKENGQYENATICHGEEKSRDSSREDNDSERIVANSAKAIQEIQSELPANPSSEVINGDLDDDIENTNKNHIETNKAIEDRLFNGFAERGHNHDDAKQQVNTGSSTTYAGPISEEYQLDVQKNVDSKEHNNTPIRTGDKHTNKHITEENEINKKSYISNTAEHSRLFEDTCCENTNMSFITTSRRFETVSEVEQDSNMKTYLILFIVILLLAWLVNYVIGPTSFVILAFALAISLATSTKDKATSKT